MMPKPSIPRNSIILACISEDVKTHQHIVPTIKDVLLGRGKTNFMREGNVRFREIVGSKMHAYLDSDKRSHRSRIICDIADEFLLTGARVLKQNETTLLWYDAGIKAAREKVGHALRDASSNKNKCIKNIHLHVLRKKEESTAGTDKKRTNPVNLLSTIDAEISSLALITECARGADEGPDVQPPAPKSSMMSLIIVNDTGPTSIDAAMAPMSLPRCDFSKCVVPFQADMILSDGVYEDLLNLKPSTSPECCSCDRSLDKYLEFVNEMTLEDLEVYLAHAPDCAQLQNLPIRRSSSLKV